MTEKALIGIAGVHFVVGELSRKGWIALPTIRNTRGIDVLATNKDTSVKIQVKTSSRSPKWILNKSAETLIGMNLLYVFVNLRGDDTPEYFIIHSETVAEYVARTHEIFLDAGGKDSNIRSLPNAYGPELDLEKYRANWKILRACKTSAGMN